MNHYSKLILPVIITCAMTFFPVYTGKYNQVVYPVQNHSSSEHHGESSVEEHILYLSAKSKIKIFQREKLIRTTKTTVPRQKDKGFIFYGKSLHHPNVAQLITKTVVLRT
jgi:hypothetical protein